MNVTTVGIKASVQVTNVVDTVATTASLSLVDDSIVFGMSTADAANSRLQFLDRTGTWAETEDIDNVNQRAAANDIPALFRNAWGNETATTRIRNFAAGNVVMRAYYWSLV